MADSRLNELLSSLSSDELNEVSLCVSSPALNKDVKVKRLFDYIIAENKPVDDIPPAELTKAVFGKSGASGVYLRVVITGLVKVIENYLVHKKLEGDPIKSSLYLLDTFKERNCRKSFNKHSRDIQTALEDTTEKDAAFYLYLAEYKTICYLNNEDPAAAGELLYEVDSFIDFSYFEFKLDVYFRMLVLDITNNNEPSYIPKINSLLEDISWNIKNIRRSHSLLHIKSLCVKMLLDIGSKKNPHFTALRSMLRKPLTEKTKLFLYRSLLTFRRLKHIKGEDSYAKEELKLYKQMMVDFPHYKPSPTELTAIKSTAIAQGEIVWAEDYLL